MLPAFHTTDHRGARTRHQLRASFRALRVAKRLPTDRRVPIRGAIGAHFKWFLMPTWLVLFAAHLSLSWLSNHLEPLHPALSVLLLTLMFSWIGVGGLAVVNEIVLRPTNHPDRNAELAILRCGLCPSCAHDLNGLPTQDDGCTICPECGAAWKLPSAPPIAS